MIPRVSVSCTTYNHAPYIAACLEGILRQVTDFEVEILIHDDASTDATQNIIKQYMEKYPGKIIPLFQQENQYSQGVRGMMPRFNFPRAQGKYLALCEGDDYWTDEYKLQKQVDFLEANSDYAICAHVSEEVNENTGSSNRFPNIKMPTTKTLEDYILNNHTATSSLMIVKEGFGIMPEWFPSSPFGDWSIVMHTLHRTQKKLMILPDCMSVYRNNAGGVHGKLKNSKTGLIKAYQLHASFLELMNKVLNLETNYQTAVREKRLNTLQILKNLNKWQNPFQVIYYQAYMAWLQVKYKIFAS